MINIVTALLMLAASDGQNDQWGSKGRQLRHMASCLVSVDGHDAQLLVSSPIGSIDQSRLGQKLANDHPGCLQKHGLSIINGDVIRGMLSEIYLKRDPSLLVSADKKPDAIPIRIPVGLNVPSFLNAYAQCLYRASPMRAVAVLKAETATADERKAVLAFDGLLSACMATDVAYHVNFEEIRVYLATQIYYDTATAQRQASADVD